MFGHVLIAVDFSPFWERLQRRLEALRAWGVERVTLVHVLSTRYPSAPEESHRAHYEARLAEEADKLHAMGFEVDYRVAVGEPGLTLVRTVEAVGADLLLMGMSGHNRAYEFFFGSTAMDAARLTRGPLWLEPIESASDNDTASILLATDGSSAVIAAERAFADLAPRFGRALALTVVAEGKDAGRAKVDAEAHLAALAAGRAEIETRLLGGRPHQKVAEQAAEMNASLIVVGQRGRNPLQTLLLGSTAEAVCKHARRPVLLVPTPRD